MFNFVQVTSVQLLERFRRLSDRCRRYYVLIEEDEVYLTASHTLSKMEKKKGFQTNTMKPMSAHDERTLDTAVAMANEITTKSMNDLDGDNRLPSSPSDRSKFHFKFPQLHLHHNQPFELDRDALGKNAERRNFSEEANSVRDIQSSITEESKLAYTSLIENPTPVSALLHANPSTMPQPVPRAKDLRTHFRSLQKPILLSAEHTTHSGINELPLPPRSTKPKLVDKPRHIRKHPLKLPTLPPERNQPIIYQNALTTLNALTCPPATVDVCDGIDKIDTNPFTGNFANPFNCFLDDMNGGLDYNVGSDDGSEENEGLVKDCSDHVSVEDLLEFADQKPCGRQRGVESDEVRIMSKVLKQQVTSEQCLQALELSEWDVHLAIKMVRVRDSTALEASLEACAAELVRADGDVSKAAAELSNKLK